MKTEELYFGYTPYSKYVALSEAETNKDEAKQEEKEQKSSKSSKEIDIKGYIENAFEDELKKFLEKEDYGKTIKQELQYKENVMINQRGTIQQQAEQIANVEKLNAEASAKIAELQKENSKLKGETPSQSDNQQKAEDKQEEQTPEIYYPNPKS